MNEVPVILLNWIEDRINPQKLNSSLLAGAGLQTLKRNFADEAKTFRCYFIDVLGRSRKQAKSSLIQIIMMSDTIHDYLTTITRSRNENILGDEIQQYYRQALTILESLLDECAKIDNNILSDLSLTTYSIPNIRVGLRKQLSILRSKIKASDIESELGGLLLSGLQLLIGRQAINRSDSEYASDILEQLNSLEPFSTFEIENLLYQYDFNTPALFNYCAKYCNKSMLDASGLHEQLEVLIGLEDRINGLPARTKSRWLKEDESIRKQLRIFYREKKSYVQQRIRLRRSEIRDRELGEEAERLQVNLPVAQFGLFIRLFMEKGLLQKEDVGKTFAYYAKHFRTPKTSFISAESLQKKSTDVEFTTAKKMKGHLIGMVNWLNKHYNTTNHGES